MDVALGALPPSAAAVGLMSAHGGQQKDSEGHCPTQPPHGCGEFTYEYGTEWDTGSMATTLPSLRSGNMANSLLLFD